jgi:GTP cyclohydrolase I
MCSTHECVGESDAIVYRGGAEEGLPLEPANTQTDQPTLIPKRRVDYAKLLTLGRELLIAIGEDPNRPGILDTPRRFADSWREFIEYDPGRIDTVFESVETDQMVVVSGMRVYSLCEHHLLPFWCDVSIAYIAGQRVLGLSKFGRIAHAIAHRPQIQERLVQEIADAVTSIVGTEDVAVLACGEHLCMTMRGIRTPAKMTSSVMRGTFRMNATARQEFLALVQHSGVRNS